MHSKRLPLAGDQGWALGWTDLMEPATSLVTFHPRPDLRLDPRRSLSFLRAALRRIPLPDPLNRLKSAENVRHCPVRNKQFSLWPPTVRKTG